MGKCLKLCAILVGSALIFGCASKKQIPVNEPQTQAVSYLDIENLKDIPNIEDEANIQAEPDVRPSANLRIGGKRLAMNDPFASQTIVRRAHSAIGNPYVRGGTAPGGFDCSGLVKWTYKSVGVNLPRTAREQSTVGKKIKNIADMRAGDIVAFRHPRRGYHTGIYVGDGKFIHSPRRRTRVRINSLNDPYFSSTLLCARRIEISDSDALIARAKNRMQELSSTREKASSMQTEVAMNSDAKSSSIKKSRSSKNRSVAKSGKSSKSNKAVSSAKTSGKSGKSASTRKNSSKKSYVKKNSKPATQNSRSHSSQTAMNKKTTHKAVSMQQKTSRASSRTHSHS